MKTKINSNTLENSDLLTLDSVELAMQRLTRIDGELLLMVSKKDLSIGFDLTNYFNRRCAGIKFNLSVLPEFFGPYTWGLSTNSECVFSRGDLVIYRPDIEK